MLAIKDIAFSVVGAVALKAVVQISANQLEKVLHWTLIKTERDIIIWTHYKKHAMRQGHLPKTPLVCNDNGCRLI